MENKYQIDVGCAVADNSMQTEMDTRILHNFINSKLPEDCLLRIFSFLSLPEQLEAMKVCRYWSVIIKRLLLCHREIIAPHDAGSIIESDKTPNVLSTENLYKVLTLCPALSVLDLHGGYSLDMVKMNLLNTIAKNCTQLRVLRFCTGANFAVPEFIKLARVLSLLEELIAPCCGLTDECLSVLFVSSKQLRILVVKGNRNITTEPFQNTPVTLEHLNINLCWNVSPVIIDMMHTRCKDTLKHLSMMNTGIEMTGVGVRPRVPMLLPNVEHLDIRSGWSIGNYWEEYMCNINHEQLEVLSEDSTYVSKLLTLKIPGKFIHDQDIRNIVNGCRDLEELEMRDPYYPSCVTETGLTYLRHAHMLVKLDVSRTATVDDHCLRAWAGLPFLQELGLNGCYGIGGDGLLFLAHHTLSLTQLDVSGNRQLCDINILKAFLANSNCRHVEIQIKYSSTNIADVAVPNLTVKEKRNFALSNLYLTPAISCCSRRKSLFWRCLRMWIKKNKPQLQLRNNIELARL